MQDNKTNQYRWPWPNTEMTHTFLNKLFGAEFQCAYKHLSSQITLNLYRGADVKGRLSCLHHFLCLAGIHWPTTNPGISVYWAVYAFYCSHTQTRILYLTCFALCSSALKLLPKDGLNLKWRLGLICRMTSVDAALSGSWLDQTTPWWFKVKHVFNAKHIHIF